MSSHATAVPATTGTDRSGVYLALAVIGAVVPLAILGVFVAEEGILDFAAFGEQAVSTTVAVMALGDLAVSSLVFWVWMWPQAPALGVRRWPFVAANLLVGLSFALPLFLYVRERKRATG